MVRLYFVLFLMLFTAGLGLTKEPAKPQSGQTYTFETLVDIDHDGTPDLIYYRAKSAGKEHPENIKFNDLFVGVEGHCDLLTLSNHPHRPYGDKVYCGKWLVASELGEPFVPQLGGSLSLSTIELIKDEKITYATVIQAVDSVGRGRKFILREFSSKTRTIEFVKSEFQAPRKTVIAGH